MLQNSVEIGTVLVGHRALEQGPQGSSYVTKPGGLQEAFGQC